MDFYDAYHYLKNLDSVHYKGESYFDKCLYMTVVKVNPKTMEIDDNTDLNTKTQVWLEFGEVYFDKMFKSPMVTHDPDLDCGGDTYEEAIIDLADLVQRKIYKKTLNQ